MNPVNEFTHILDIKIIHHSDNNIVRNKDLLKQVKRYLIEYKIPQTISWNGTHEEVLLSWQRKRWPPPYNKFIGDLVVNSSYNVDSIIQDHTTMSIRYIVEELRLKFSYWNDFDVVFNITKPLSTKKPIPIC
jgi:hypothetical protein